MYESIFHSFIHHLVRQYKDKIIYILILEILDIETMHQEKKAQICWMRKVQHGAQVPFCTKAKLLHLLTPEKNKKHCVDAVFFTSSSPYIFSCLEVCISFLKANTKPQEDTREFSSSE